MEYDPKNMTEEERMNVAMEGIMTIMNGDRDALRNFIAKISNPMQHESFLIEHIRNTYLGGCDNITDYLLQLVEGCRITGVSDAEASLIIDLASRVAFNVRKEALGWMTSAQLYGDEFSDFLATKFSATDEQLNLVTAKLLELHDHIEARDVPNIGQYL